MDVNSKTIRETFANYTKRSLGLLTIFAAFLSIYAFFSKNKIDVQYEIISNSNIIDINASVGRLDIIFDNISLTKKNQNVRLVQLRVTNKGSQAVLKNFYDLKAPLGFVVTPGSIVGDPEILEASSTYLHQNLSVTKINDSLVIFSDVIIEPNERFLIKLLIKHNNNEVPIITPKGKLAGQKKITIHQFLPTREPFYSKAFSGPLLIQLSRLFGYTLAIGACITLLVFSMRLIVVIRKKFSKRRRWKIVANFRNIYGGGSTPRILNNFFLEYANTGPNIVIAYRELLNNTEKILGVIPTIDSNQPPAPDINKKTPELLNLIEKNQDGYSYVHTFGFTQAIVSGMLRFGIITSTNGMLQVNEPVKNWINTFFTHLTHIKEIRT